MENFVVTCCSSADMPESFFEERNIKYAGFHILIDGRDYIDDHGKTIPYKVFYDMIRQGSMPKTSQPNIAQYTELFEPYLKEGKKVLHIEFSSGLSGAYSTSKLAREKMLEQYPDATIIIVDSLAASGGYGMLVSDAADMRDQGKTIEEAADELEKRKLNLNHWFYSTDLTSYYRGGRISKTSQVFGTLLQICPLININNVGKLIIRDKFRGKKKTMAETVEMMKEHAYSGVSYSGKCFITHSDCEEDAKLLASMIEETFSELKGKVEISYIGASVGAHTGPDTIALFFYGDQRGE